MAFEAAELSVELIEALEPLVRKVERRDRSLADQMRRAGSSVALNLSEGNLSQGGNRRARFFSAAASARETMMSLRVAVAWRYLVKDEVAEARQICDRLLAILWKLTH